MADIAYMDCIEIIYFDGRSTIYCFRYQILPLDPKNNLVFEGKEPTDESISRKP